MCNVICILFDGLSYGIAAILLGVSECEGKELAIIDSWAVGSSAEEGGCYVMGLVFSAQQMISC